jgi:integrase
MHITHKAVEKLKPGAKRFQIADDELKGFGVRVEADGKKSFYWSARIRGKLYFRHLGEHPSVTVEQARTEARTLIGVASGWRASGFQEKDPFEREHIVQDKGVPLFKELVEAYITRQVRVEANRPVKAEADLRGRLKTHFNDWMERKLDSLTVDDVVAVKEACGKHHVTANRNTELIRRMFTWSARTKDGRINFRKVENIAKDVELWEEEEREVFLQPEQVASFQECLKNEEHADLKDFLTLAMETGARKSDIFSMKWEDWHPERKIWTVAHPKMGPAYDVSLLPAATAVLERRQQSTTDSEEFVFPGVGKEGHLMELRKPWDTFRKRAKIPDIHVHDLRRTVGSYLAINGTPLQQIAAVLGHKSMQSTLIYARLQDQAVRDAREGGQAKMMKLMKAAKRNAKKLAAVKPKLLKMANAS